MSRILLGLYHIPHVNFFKNAIDILEKEGIECLIYLRERGDLLDIAKEELKRDDFVIIGKHRTSTMGKAFGLLKVGLSLFKLLYENKDIKVVTSIGANELCRVSRLLNRNSISFNDDPDTHVFRSTLKLANKLIIPKLLDFKGNNIYHYNGYKELAYLGPNYFTPNPKVIDDLGLEENNYIFIREQSPISLVYRHISSDFFKKVVTKLHERKIKLVFSLESKDEVNFYSSKGLVLEEPVEDIHSILKFASMTLTTGDTLSRESCLLGTPSIYAGKRDMPINEELISIGIMKKVDNANDILVEMDTMIDKNIKAHLAPKIDELVSSHWIDTTELIVSQIKESVKNAEI